VPDDRPVELHLGIPQLIPEDYVPEPEVRLSLYRRLAGLADAASVAALAEEIADRFGTLPDPVRQLIELCHLRQRCRAAGIARLQAGPKGIAVEFHEPGRARRAQSGRSSDNLSVHWRGDRLICSTDRTTTPEQRLHAAHALLNRLAPSSS
jgi:transcription-repair coupling factor (superfamily II helicase)